MGQQKHINFSTLFFAALIIAIYCLSSCSATGGIGCGGNKAMLTAGGGYTKWRIR